MKVYSINCLWDCRSADFGELPSGLSLRVEDSRTELTPKPRRPADAGLLAMTALRKSRIRQTAAAYGNIKTIHK